MARANTTQSFFNFTGGINSEFNAASYPENTAVNIVNMDLGANGVLARRRSLVGEPTASYFSANPLANRYSNFVNTFLWKNADNVATQNFIVVQVDDEVYIYTTSALGITGPNFETVITLADWDDSIVHFSTADGKLVMCHNKALPEVVSYSTSGNSFSNATLDMFTRDFAGVDDSLDTDENPAGPKASEEEHWYNLRNQGWDEDKIDQYQTTLSVMPSNAEIWYVAKAADTNLFTGTEATNLSNFDFGTTSAPKGRVLLDISNPDTSRNDAFPDTAVTSPVVTDNFPAASAGFASRVFFAQGASNNNRPRILFSQLLSLAEKEVATLGKCYQRNDPTADTFNQLLETDGGVIEIPEMGDIKGMEVVQNSLLVLADNGVWQISGQGSALTATNISVSKLTSVGVASPNSIVNTGDSVYYWAESGIFNLTYDSQSLVFAAKSIAASSIQTLFSNRFQERSHAKGDFDKRTGKIMWYIPPTLGSGTPTFDLIDHCLILDIRSGAFSTYELKKENDIPYGLSILAVEEEDLAYPDFNGNDLVDAVNHIPLGFKVITLDPLGAISDPTHIDSFTFSTFTGAPGAVDSIGAESADWIILTGAYTLGDPSRSKDITNLTALFNRTETTFTGTGESDIDPVSESGCLGRVLWDWSDGNDNRVTPQQQLYRLARDYVPFSNSSVFSYGKDVIATKTRYTGAGRAMQFEFTNDGTKDCQLIGWSVDATAGASV